MTAIALEGVSKVFANGVRAVHRLDLEVRSGELLVLVGPSGCGKTTTLRLIAGLETPTTGTIRFDGRDAAGIPPSRRDLAMVFQRPALYPHLTVQRNLGFALEMQRPAVPTAQAQERVGEVARLLGLAGLLDRYPEQLSGGQQQRVALGRALVRRPKILLLDEPLAGLDAPLRGALRRELHLLHRRLPATMIHVTHDPLEALALANRVAILDRGAIQQVGPPEVIRRSPVSRFVAGFFSASPVNFLDGSLVQEEGRLTLVGDGWRLPLPGAPPNWIRHAGRAVSVGLRAEDVEVIGLAGGGTARPDDLEMKAALIEPTPHGWLVSLVRCDQRNGPKELQGFYRPAEWGRIEEGRGVLVRHHLDRAHLFDRTTGLALGDSSPGR